MTTYPTLSREISSRGIKLRVIASAINISERTLYNKIRGIRPFTWDEVKVIQSRFFPDISVDDLFEKEV